MPRLPALAFPLTIFLGLSCLTAHAGPLRERLAERLTQRGASDPGNLEDTDLPSQSGRLPSGVQVQRNISYGDDPNQRFDVYFSPSANNAPVIFMAHGGAWRSGDKAMRRVIDNKVARWVPRGIVFISANYRLVPQADPLRQAEDLAHALAAAQSKAGAWHADPTKFVLMGHSAGAHLVSLINARPDLATGLGARPWLGTISLDTAGMDIVSIMQSRHYRFYDAAFGKDPAYWQSTSPMQQLSSNAPPMLAICSTVRPDHPCPATHAFAAKANDMVLRMEVSEQPLSHADTNAQLGVPSAYTDRVEAFLRSLDAGLAARLR